MESGKAKHHPLSRKSPNPPSWYSDLFFHASLLLSTWKSHEKETTHIGEKADPCHTPENSTPPQEKSLSHQNRPHASSQRDRDPTHSRHGRNRHRQNQLLPPHFAPNPLSENHSPRSNRTLCRKVLRPSTQDTLLNPFDPRTAPWHPWSECTTTFDYDTLAESLIPQTLSDHENYWRTAARTLLSTLLQKLSDTKRTSELSHWLLYQPLDKLAEFLEGTKAAAHIDIHSEKTAASIRSVAASYLTCLEHLPDTTTPFSIKTWIQDPSPGWLFLYTKPSERVTLNPLLSSWFSTATRSLLSLSPDLKRRAWFVIDEFPIFQKLQALDSLITEGRKYGAWRPPHPPKLCQARRDLRKSRFPNDPRELRHPPHLC